MTEGEVVQELVEFTNILLVGVSLIFSVVSAYVVALNYFIGSANFIVRFGCFAFVSLVVGMLVATMMGAQGTQVGLIERLREIQAAGDLTAAGQAVLTNATPGSSPLFLGADFSIDQFIRGCVWVGLIFVYGALAYLTFLHQWRPDVLAVKLQQDKK